MYVGIKRLLLAYSQLRMKVIYLNGAQCKISYTNLTDGEPSPRGTALVWDGRGAGFKSPRGNILCSPSPSEKTIN